MLLSFSMWIDDVVKDEVKSLSISYRSKIPWYIFISILLIPAIVEPIPDPPLLLLLGVNDAFTDFKCLKRSECHVLSKKIHEYLEKCESWWIQTHYKNQDLFYRQNTYNIAEKTMSVPFERLENIRRRVRLQHRSWNSLNALWMAFWHRRQPKLVGVRNHSGSPWYYRSLVVYSIVYSVGWRALQFFNALHEKMATDLYNTSSYIWNSRF